jgi:hypothetical protein
MYAPILPHRDALLALARETAGLPVDMRVEADADVDGLVFRLRGESGDPEGLWRRVTRALVAWCLDRDVAPSLVVLEPSRSTADSDA